MVYLNLIKTLLRNYLKLDIKMLIPFLITMVLVILLISATSVSNALFIEFARQPIISYIGGEIALYKSSEEMQVKLTKYGLSVTCSLQLFEAKDISNISNKDNTTYQLLIDGRIKTTMSPISLHILGRQENSNTADLTITEGEVPIISSREQWETDERPVILYASYRFLSSSTTNIKLGGKKKVFVPKIIPSGGDLNIIGEPNDAPGIDYLDYENGEWLDVTVAAIAKDQISRSSYAAIIVPLDILQEMTGAENKINLAGIQKGTATEAEIHQDALEITNGIAGFYGMRSTDILTGMSKDILYLERHANRLLFISYLIGSLIIICSLILIIRSRRNSDAQLIALGISRRTLLIVTVIEMLFVTTLAVILGVIIPLIISLISSSKILSQSIKFVNFFAIIPFNTIISVIILQIMLPNSKQCLEALRNE